MGILAKLIELKESYDLCYLWRVKNTTSKRFSFTQKHLSGFTQHRLDYTFISSTFQELANTTEIPTPLSSDYSLVLFSLSKGKDSDISEIKHSGNLIAS